MSENWEPTMNLRWLQRSTNTGSTLILQQQWIGSSGFVHFDKPPTKWREMEVVNGATED